MSSSKTVRAHSLGSGSFWLSLFVALCAVFAPSNLFYGFDQFDWAVRGLRIDYLLPKLYLTDLFLLGIVGTSLIFTPLKKIRFSFFEKLLIIFLSLIFARQWFAEFPAAAITQFLRLSLFGFSAWIVVKNWSSLKLNWVWLGLAGSNLFEGFLSLWQFFTQHSLGSYRWLFGEPNLSQSFGLAQASFGSWGEKILPYGTTAHPNILAAWLVTSWLLLMVWAEKISLNKPVKNLLLVSTGLFALWSIAATQSLTALGLLLHGIVYLVVTHFRKFIKLPSPKIGFSLLVFLMIISPVFLASATARQLENWIPTTSITRRVFLQSAAQSLLLQHPLWGVGLNQFTANLETSAFKEQVRFDQPAHHVLWLFLAETGLVGLLLLTGFIWRSFKTNPDFLAALTTCAWLLFPSLVWDHYLLSLTTGLWIGWFWWLTVVKTPANLA